MGNLSGRVFGDPYCHGLSDSKSDFMISKEVSGIRVMDIHGIILGNGSGV